MAQKTGRWAMAALVILFLFLLAFGILTAIYGVEKHRRDPGLAQPAQALTVLPIRRSE